MARDRINHAAAISRHFERVEHMHADESRKVREELRLLTALLRGIVMM
jgi:hypothetical protein